MTIRVVSLEISGGKFPEFILIFPEIFNFTYANQLFPSPALQSTQ